MIDKVSSAQWIACNYMWREKRKEAKGQAKQDYWQVFRFLLTYRETWIDLSAGWVTDKHLRIEKREGLNIEEARLLKSFLYVRVFKSTGTHGSPTPRDIDETIYAVIKSFAVVSNRDKAQNKDGPNEAKLEDRCSGAPFTFVIHSQISGLWGMSESATSFYARSAPLSRLRPLPHDAPRISWRSAGREFPIFGVLQDFQERWGGPGNLGGRRNYGEQTGDFARALYYNEIEKRGKVPLQSNLTGKLHTGRIFQFTFLRFSFICSST